jgi:hypothetical protein
MEFCKENTPAQSLLSEKEPQSNEIGYEDINLQKLGIWARC